MFDKLFYISNDEKQNYPICRLKLAVDMFNTQLNELNQISPTLLSQQIRKCYYKTLGLVK